MIKSDADYELSILLWNVWNLPSWLTDNKSRTRALQISPLLNEFDVVVLNEAFVNHAALLSQVKHKHKFIPARSWTCLFSSGLLFLSKHKIVNSGYEKFAHRSGVDRFAAKGIAFIEVKVVQDAQSLGRVKIYGTHMQASYGTSAQQARLAQSIHVAEMIRRNLNDSRERIVLAGDMNMGPRRLNGAGHSQHYFDSTDAQNRTEAYTRLVRESTVLDLTAFTAAHRDEYEYSNEICRMLVSDSLIDCHHFEYVLQPYTDGGNRLSDTKALCLHLRLAAASSVA